MTIPMIRTLLLAALLVPTSAAAQSTSSSSIPTQHNEATVAQLQAEMAAGTLTSEGLTMEYIARILALDQNGPGVNAVIELNPDALAMARNADALRKRGVVLGPLHGIPVLLKDNIDTGDKMQTSAGSFALVGTPALQDSTVAANLRAGGAVILGKTNLSEWANFRSFDAAGRRTTPTASIATPAARAPARARRRRRISPRCPSAARPTAASCVPQTLTASWASSPRLGLRAGPALCPFRTRRTPWVRTDGRWPMRLRR